MAELVASDLDKIACLYHGKLFGCALSLCTSHQEAEDLLQASWERFCRRVQGGGVSDDFVFAYLVRILKNEAARRHARKAEAAEAREFAEAEAPAVPDASGQMIVRLLLEDCLERLDPACAGILRGRFFEGRPMREICKAEGLSYTTAQRLAKTGLTRLRDMFVAAGMDWEDFYE